MLSFTARVLSAEIVETRSTAWANSLQSSASDFVVAGRDDALIIRERAVDQLGGQFHAVEGELDLGVRQRNFDGAVGIVEQPAQLRRSSCAARSRRACRPAPSGSSSSKRARRWPSVATARSIRVLSFLRGMQINAVQIEARFFGRDREARLVDRCASDRRRRGGIGGAGRPPPSAGNLLSAGRQARSARCRPRPQAGRLRW